MVYNMLFLGVKPCNVYLQFAQDRFLQVVLPSSRHNMFSGHLQESMAYKGHANFLQGVEI